MNIAEQIKQHTAALGGTVEEVEGVFLITLPGEKSEADAAYLYTSIDAEFSQYSFSEDKTKFRLTENAALFEVKGVEIFRAGTWNEDKYTVKDLDDIVSAFNEQDFKPPIKLGHKESSGDKAFGWVVGLQRVGDKLVADFSDLSKETFEAIKARSFDTVSSEIFFNLKRGGKVFRRALKAVALLGAELPAVAGLKPLRDSISFNSADFEVEHAYSLSNEVMSMDIKELQAELDKAQAKIEELSKNSGNDDTVKALQAQVDSQAEIIKGLTASSLKNAIEAKLNSLKVPAYREFFRPVLDALMNASAEDQAKTYSFGSGDDKKDLKAVEVVEALFSRINDDAEKMFKTITKHSADDPAAGGDVKTKAEATAKVDELTKKYMQDNKTDDYQAAMYAVLGDKANAEIVAIYNS